MPEQPHIGGSVETGGLRDDADDLHPAIRQRDLPTDDVVAASVPVPPQRLSQHSLLVRIRLIVCRDERAPREGSSTVQRKEISRDRLHPDLLGLTVPGEAHRGVHDRRHPFEQAAVPSVIEEIGGRQRAAFSEARRRPHHHQSIRVGVRQGLQQHAVHHAEHGGRAANAERERQHGGRAGEAGLQQ